jgi:hypothetical protein
MSFSMPLQDDLTINGYKLICTSCGCPEQYEVFKDDKQVGYLRLRGGVFRIDYPDIDGFKLYEKIFDGELYKGNFEDEERAYYLSLAIYFIESMIRIENEKSKSS